MKKIPKELQFVLVICLVNFFILLPFANHPANFDEVNYFGSAINIYNNGLNPFVLDPGSYKPPLIHLSVAILFKIFSFSLIWGRIYIAIYSSLALLFIYLLGNKLFGKKVGLYSLFFLFFFPTFVAQSLTLSDAVPLTAISLAVLYFYFSKKNTAYLISAILLVLTKEPALFILLFIWAYDLIVHFRFYKHQWKQFILKSFLILTPILVFFIWLILNKIFLGWFLWPGATSYFLKKGLKYYLSLENIIWLIHFIIFRQKVWLIFLIPIISKLLSFTVFRSKIKPKKEIALFLSLFIFYGVFYYLTALLFRYLLFVFALIFIVSAYYLKHTFKQYKNLVISIICLFFLVYNLNSYLYSHFDYLGDNDLGLFKAIKYHQQLIKYIETNYRDSNIITTFPLYQYLNQPLFGYVKKPFNLLLVNCSDPLATKCINPDMQNIQKAIIINTSFNYLRHSIPKDVIFLKKFYFETHGEAEIYLLNNNRKLSSDNSN